MPAVIEGVPLGAWEVGGWGLFVVLCLVIVLAFLRGKIQSPSTAQLFKDAWERAVEANRQKDATIDELLELGRTSVKLLRDIQEAKGGEGRGMDKVREVGSEQPPKGGA